MMDSFRYVGATPTEIEEGEDIRRPIEPGEFTGEIDVTEAFPHNKMLFDEGNLLTAEPVADKTTRQQQEKQGEDIKAAEKTAQEKAEQEAAANAASAAEGKAGDGS
jgi:hypothetical protein